MLIFQNIRRSPARDAYVKPWCAATASSRAQAASNGWLAAAAARSGACIHRVR